MRNKIARNPAQKNCKRNTGATLVEFALTFPLVMILILAIIDYSRYLVALNALTTTAQEALSMLQTKPGLEEIANNQYADPSPPVPGQVGFNRWAEPIMPSFIPQRLAELSGSFAKLELKPAAPIGEYGFQTSGNSATPNNGEVVQYLEPLLKARLQFPPYEANAATRASATRRFPVKVYLQADFKFILAPFLGSITLASEASGMREAYRNTTDTARLACDGLPFVPGTIISPTSCSCGIGAIVDPQTGRCDCRPAPPGQTLSIGDDNGVRTCVYSAAGCAPHLAPIVLPSGRPICSCILTAGGDNARQCDLTIGSSLSADPVNGACLCECPAGQERLALSPPNDDRTHICCGPNSSIIVVRDQPTCCAGGNSARPIVGGDPVCCLAGEIAAAVFYNDNSSHGTSVCCPLPHNRYSVNSPPPSEGEGPGAGSCGCNAACEIAGEPVVINGVTVTCGAAVLDKSTCRCNCPLSDPPGYSCQNDGGSCRVRGCTPGTDLDPGDSNCPRGSYNFKTCSCDCEAGSSCPPGLIWPVGGAGDNCAACVCPPGRQFVPEGTDACECSNTIACTPPNTWDPINCECRVDCSEAAQCTNGQVRGPPQANISCPCISPCTLACTLPDILDTVNCRCSTTCPIGSYFQRVRALPLNPEVWCGVCFPHAHIPSNYRCTL